MNNIKLIKKTNRFGLGIIFLMLIFCISCGTTQSLANPSNNSNSEQTRQDLIQIAERLKLSPYISNQDSTTNVKSIKGKSISVVNGIATSNRINATFYPSTDGWHVSATNEYGVPRVYAMRNVVDPTRPSVNIAEMAMETNEKGLSGVTKPIFYFMTQRDEYTTETTSTRNITHHNCSGTVVIEDASTGEELIRFPSITTVRHDTIFLGNTGHANASENNVSVELEVSKYNGSMNTESKTVDGKRVDPESDINVQIFSKATKSKVGKIVFKANKNFDYEVLLD